MVHLLSQESSYVSTSPSSSLDVGPVIQPLAECRFSKSLLKIQLISTVLTCAKNAYCSSSCRSAFYKLPQTPSASAPSKYNMVTWNFALTFVGVMQEVFQNIHRIGNRT